jgi:hypothetical protein
MSRSSEKPEAVLPSQENRLVLSADTPPELAGHPTSPVKASEKSSQLRINRPFTATIALRKCCANSYSLGWSNVYLIERFPATPIVASSAL